MSLDLYLRSKTPRRTSGTGVFVRKNGQNVELKTIEEVKEHFPDADLSEIEERLYETCDIFDRNITHNLTTMASNVQCGSSDYDLYKLLWRPDENGFEKVTFEYRDLVSDGLAYMLSNRASLEQFNPSNGWGSYESLLNFVIEYCKALSVWDGNEEWIIHAWR